MKKTFLCLLALLFALSLTAVADGTEVLQKDLLSEDTTLALSVNDFVTDSEYPYETVGYFLDDIAFTSEDTAEVTITFTGNYGSNEYFFSNCYIPIYNYETGKLLDIFYSEVELKKPFATSSRTSITREISLKDAPANIYKIKVLMLESLSSLRPNCPVPYLANELVIAKNDIGTKPEIAIISAVLNDVPLNKDNTNFIFMFHIDNIIDAPDGFLDNNLNDTITKTVNRNNVNIIPYQGLICDFTIDVSDKNNWKLLSITPTEGKNIEVTVNPALLANPRNGEYVEYYKTNDDEKVSKLKLAADYNGLNVSAYVNLETTSYSSAVVKGGNANDVAYRFVDTDNNGDFDTVFVDREQIFIASYINSSNGKIFRDTSATAGATYKQASLTLDKDDLTLDWSIKDTEGNTMDITDIEEGSIIAVKTSEKASGTFHEIIVSNETAEGTILEKYDDKTKVYKVPFTKYTVGEDVYTLLDESINHPELGQKITAKVYNGKIIGYQVSDDYINYGLIIATDIKIAYGTNTYSVQLLNQKGNIVAVDLSETVNEQEMIVTKFTSDFSKGTLIAYTLDDNGKLAAYDVVSPSTDSSGNVVPAGTKFERGNATYLTTAQKLGKYYVTENTIIFVTGEEIKTSTVDLATVNYLMDESEYEFALISDENNEIKAVVLFNSLMPNSSTPIDYDVAPFLITQKSSIYTNGQTAIELTGYVDGEEASIILSDNMAAGLKVSDFAVGDIILYSTNTIGDLYDAKWLVENNGTKLVVADNSRAVIEATGKTNTIYNTNDVAYDEITLATSRFTELNKEADWDTAKAITIATGRMTKADSGSTLKGFGIVGSAYRVQGNLLRVLDVDNYETTFTATGREYDKLVNGDEKLITDITINSNAVAYYYNAQTGKYKVSSIMDAETDYINNDYNIRGQLTNDDFVYVYSYDGDTKLIVVVDVNGDNY